MSRTDCDDMLDGYKPYSKEGSRLTKHGRCSGGIKIFIKEELAKYFKLISNKFMYAVSFEVDERLSGQEFLYVVTYLPPEGSAVYRGEEENGVILLEDYLIKLRVKYPNHEVLLTGDFNARTQNKPDYIVHEGVNHLPCTDLYKCDDFNIPRCSKDTHG